MSTDDAGKPPPRVQLDQSAERTKITLLPLGPLRAGVGCHLVISISILSLFYWLASRNGFPHKIHSLGIDLGEHFGEWFFWGFIIGIGGPFFVLAMIDASISYTVFEVRQGALQIEAVGLMRRQSWSFCRGEIADVGVVEAPAIGAAKTGRKFLRLQISPIVGAPVALGTDRSRSELEWVAQMLRPLVHKAT